MAESYQWRSAGRSVWRWYAIARLIGLPLKSAITARTAKAKVKDNHTPCRHNLQSSLCHPELIAVLLDPVAAHAVLDVVVDNVVQFFLGETVVLSQHVVDSVEDSLG